MARTKRRALVFLIDQMRLAQSVLSDEELGLLYRALFIHGTGGSVEELDMANKSAELRCIFKMMMAADDDARERYEETCKRNQAAANSRWSKAAQQNPYNYI